MSHQAQSSRIGRLGELLTMYHLERHGIDCVLVDREYADIWIRLPDGSIWSVQVKTTRRPPDEGDKHGPRYRFRIEDRANVDLFSLVALDVGVVLLFPALFVPSNVSIRKFTAATMDENIKKYVLEAT